jgi:Zn-dependent protease
VPEGNSILVPLALVAFWGIVLNLVLGIFNLIPVAPLDGAAILSGFIPRSLTGVFQQDQSYGFMILIALLFLGVPSMLYMPVLGFFVSFLSL